MALTIYIPFPVFVFSSTKDSKRENEEVAGINFFGVSSRIEGGKCEKQQQVFHIFGNEIQELFLAICFSSKIFGMKSAPFLVLAQTTASFFY